MINHKDQLVMFSCCEDCDEICHNKDMCCQECEKSLTCQDVCKSVQYKNHIYGNNEFMVKELNELAEKQDNWLIAVAAQQLNRLAEENKLLKSDDALIVLKKIERLETELTRLQVALEATIAEKERCRKLAVEHSVNAASLEQKLSMCENMKLAHEFEDLLQTTSIPVAVERLKELIAKASLVGEARGVSK